jgi:glutamate racemase
VSLIQVLAGVVYVIERTRKIGDFLVSLGAKALVVACNTASVLAVQKIRAEHSNTIVLGCSHYQFLANEISAIAGPLVQLVDPVQAVARELVRRLTPVVASPAKLGSVVFYTSVPIPPFSAFSSSVGEPCTNDFRPPNE